MLFKLSKRKKVRLIISKSAANREALDYIKRKFGRHIAYAKTSLFFAVISVISFVIRFYYAFLFCIAITAIFAALSTLFYKRRGFKNLQIRVSDEVFIHEKIYINEYAAVTGSANLTYNGLYKNIEHIDLTNNPDKVAALKKHFDRIWPQLKPLA
jgi:phosphatidylserine/phosphatidylglycerophosphate/cardiolipin synthase-like enzyme